MLKSLITLTDGNFLVSVGPLTFGKKLMYFTSEDETKQSLSYTDIASVEPMENKYVNTSHIDYLSAYQF